ncbi:Uma2 family endonuclease [Desulfobacterales bacterium HSG2]|nr:Uma2 family endonuclease [Desulfobacterales bacterium HSG2]
MRRLWKYVRLKNWKTPISGYAETGGASDVSATLEGVPALSGSPEKEARMETLNTERASERGGGFSPPVGTDISEFRPFDGVRVSEEEYWEKYYEYAGPDDRIFEWNNGVLEEKPMGDHLSYLTSDWFHTLLKQYLEACPVAEIFGTDMGFRLLLPHKAVIRRPDLSLVLNTNPIRFGPLDRSYSGVFDICIEFLSDSTKADIERDTKHKHSEYAFGGVGEYYILDRLGKETAFYRLGPRGFYLPILPASGGIIRSSVLPGFQFREADLYTRPSLIKMAEDAVYKAFVLRDWQAERGRADNAEKKTEKAEKKAERAEKKVEAERRKVERAEKKAERAVETERKKVERAEKKAEAERRKVERAEKKAEAERKKAERAVKAERRKVERAEKKAEAERKKAEGAVKAEREKARKLAEKLRALGIDPESP